MACKRKKTSSKCEADMNEQKVDDTGFSKMEAPEQLHDDKESCSESDADTSSGDADTSSGDADVSLQTKLDELNDRYLRLAAEYDNFRKRTRKELEDFKKYAVSDFVERLLPTLDTLYRAIDINEKAQAIEPVKEGFLKLARMLEEALAKEGLTKIEEVMVPVDFNFHMAVFQEENSEVEDGTVLQVFEPGYRLKDKVLRHAKVKVSKKIEATQSE